RPVAPRQRPPASRQPPNRRPPNRRPLARPGAKKKPGLFWRYRRIWFLFGFLSLTGLAGAAWVITQIPMPSEAPLAETTLIFDASGQQVAELHGVENRYPVKIEQVPAITQAAIIAAEDRQFLRHRGVDPWSILRATWADIRSKGATQGGSTISQQYVKNQIVGSERSLIRKLKEAVVAIKLERKYSKMEILEKYLNTVYFGRGAYGIQAATKTYFGKKDVSELDLKESAYLAGLIRTPSSGDVYVDPESAYYLRTSVLRNMVKDGSITQADMDQVEQTKIEQYVFTPERADTTFTNVSDGAEYFVEYVRRQLVGVYGEDRVLRGGLRVYTTLDPKVQAMAYRSVYDTLKDEDGPIGSLVSLDSEGRVVAMVGNRSWAKSQVNVAVGQEAGGSGRQGGSAFKPFVLAEAINQGISVSGKYYAAPAKIGPLQGWEHEVNNYAGANFGHINLTEATINSVNTVYAQLVGEVKASNVAKMAKDLGITSDLAAVPSITLGTQEVSVMEMAVAYLTFYKDGVHVDPRVITKVTENGSILVDDKPTGVRRAIPEATAQQVKRVLGLVVERGSGYLAGLPNSDVWGKTGTTDEFGDAWFVGANEKLVTAVWMGYPDGQRSLTNIQSASGFVQKVAGGTLPAIMFRNFMNVAAPGDGKAAALPTIDARTLNNPTPVPTARPSASSSASESVAATTTTPPPPETTTTVGPLPQVVVTQPTTTAVPIPNPVLTAPTIPGTTPTTRRPTPSIPSPFP
ncbi:MAG: transglycosylase domain-containing protein, partial [Acidimicrobiales bacterium]